MTLSALGIFSAAGAGGLVAASDFEFISTANGTGSSGTITFSSISQDYKHLQVRYVGSNTTASETLLLRFNGITTSVYAVHYLGYIGTDAFPGNAASQTQITLPTGIVRGDAGGGEDNVSGGIIDILDYASTSKNTTVRTLYGCSGQSNQITLLSALYGQTTAVSSITLFTASGNFTTKSRFSLFGIRG
jgi:hypothetical protein